MSLNVPLRPHLNRDGDKPAIVDSNGSKEWYKNGKLHRDGNEPALIAASGEMVWSKDGKLHRNGDEPAVIKADGTKVWYKNDKHHRETGPARIGSNGALNWYYRGTEYTPKDWAQRVLYGQGKPTTPKTVDELLKGAYIKALQDTL